MTKDQEAKLLEEIEFLVEECKTQGDDARIANVMECVDDLLNSQKEEWVEVLKSEEFAQRCEWRYWYKKENNPDTNFAAGYERALNDIINQLESNHA